MTIFHKIKSSSEPTIRLICFGYAGGSIQTLNGWQNSLPDHVELLLVQLPGHGMQILQPPLNSMQEIIESLLIQTPNYMELPYILLGHSLGAKICFEYMKALKKASYRMPSYFVASGCSAPRLKSEMFSISPLDEKQVMHELKKLGGTPDEILENIELMPLLMPTLLADFNIAASYHDKEKFTVTTPLCLIAGGRDQRVDSDKLYLWKESFVGETYFNKIDDDHFFIESSRDCYLRILTVTIKHALSNLYDIKGEKHCF